MPTPAEQKALAFVALVILLGGTVRAVRGSSPSSPGASPAEQQALARQAFAASSAAALDRSRHGSNGRNKVVMAPKRRHTGSKFDSTGVLYQGPDVLGANGFPPPGPRIDVDMRGPTPAMRRSEAPPRGDRAQSAVGDLVDLDVAGAGEIARLPRLGPALATRIVANRDSQGPFGVLSALGRVKGIGPATLERLASLVTFSGQARR